MRNIDRLRQMSLEELAPLLIHCKEIDIENFDWDENPIPYYETFWFSPSGNEFVDYSGEGYDEALQDCIKWLDSEFKNCESNN